MKKALIGMLAGAAALGGAVMPASGAYNDPLWTDIQDWSDGSSDPDATGFSATGLDVFEDLMFMTNLPSLIDSCGSKVTKYTVFPPLDGYLALVLDALGETTASASSKSAVVKALLSDHIHEGDISEYDWADATIKNFKMISGATVSVTYRYPYNKDNTNTDAWNYAEDVAINGTWIFDGYQSCNGWYYPLLGYIDTSSQPSTTGLQQDTTVTGTAAAASSLPNTL